MKHVLLIHQAFASPKDAGGTRHYEFAQLLHPTEQFQFTVIASNLSYLGTKVEEPQVPDPVMRVLRAQTRPSQSGFVERLLSFLSFMMNAVIVSRQVTQVDLVMGTTPPIFQAVSAWLVSVWHRKPFLLEVRDLWPAFAIDIGVLKNPVLIQLSYWLEAFLYNRATHLLVNSPAYRDYLLNRGIARQKITLIPNGVDPDMFDPNVDGTPIRRQWGVEGKFTVMYAGALGMANDLGIMVRAAQRLQDYPEIHFLLVGDGRERENLQMLVQSMNLTNFTFTGSVPKNEMSNVLGAANVCVASLKNIPMFRTTYPNKVFDYMAAGKPTLLAIDGVIRDVVEDAQAGIFVEPGNDMALAEAILQLNHNPEEVYQMGLSGRRYVEQHFNRHHHAERFGELIEQLITQN